MACYRLLYLGIMADYFLISELIKYFELDNTLLMYYNSFVYKAKLKTSTVINSYFFTTFGAEDETNKEVLNIKGLIIDVENFYSRQESIYDCLNNEESFYFDILNQEIYIHFDHNINPYGCVIEYGKVFGFTNDMIRNFNGIDYLPELISIPNLSLKVDPLRYTKQGFYGGDVIFNNCPIDGSNNGEFDSNSEFTGNDIFLYYGQDGDEYTDLILIASNYVENTIISMNRIIVKTKDKREQQTKKAPTEIFNDTDYPDIDPDLIGNIKQDAYGQLYAVPGICVNSEQAGNKTFYFASVITASPAPVFESKQDEKWTVIVPSATDYANGQATFANADVHVDGDNTKGLLDVRCTGYFRPYHNPGDIIADLNDRFLNITYNSSNYNTTEWEDEKQYLTNVGLFMKDQKEIYQWIEQLQNGSTVGFQYLFLNGKRTMKLDNPNKDSVRMIYAQEILNDLEFNNNEDFFSTDAVINYRQNNFDDSFMRFENNEYHTEVFREHRKNSQYKTDCLMYLESSASDKSYIILEDQKKERPTGDIVLFGKEFFYIELFDIINCELSKPGEKVGYRLTNTYVKTDDGIDVYVKTDDTIGIDLYEKADYTREDKIINYREFLGWQRSQIIGLTFDFVNATIRLTIRQRDYSTVFDSITGYNT